MRKFICQIIVYYTLCINDITDRYPLCDRIRKTGRRTYSVHYIQISWNIRSYSMRFEFWRRCRKKIMQKVHLVSSKRDEPVLPYLFREWSELNHLSLIERVKRCWYCQIRISSEIFLSHVFEMSVSHKTRPRITLRHAISFFFRPSSTSHQESYLRHLHSESYIWSVKDILKNSYSLSYFSSTFRSQDFFSFQEFHISDLWRISRHDHRYSIIDFCFSVIKVLMTYITKISI